MKRAVHLFVPSLTGCLLVASLLSSCTSVHGPMSIPAAEGPQPAESPPPDTLGAEPPPSRVEIGIASWYGKGFHGRQTASGEPYDMHQATAAHRTADLGTYAVVTNLENGQSVRVRINDRGPFKRNRILDLSYEAARQLAMVRTGSARVKVAFLEDAPPPIVPIVMPTSVAQEERPSTAVSALLEAQPLFVQAGAYRDQYNAARVQKTLPRYIRTSGLLWLLSYRRPCIVSASARSRIVPKPSGSCRRCKPGAMQPPSSRWRSRCRRGGVERDPHTIMAAEGREALTQLCRQRPRMASADGAAIDANHRHDFRP